MRGDIYKEEKRKQKMKIKLIKENIARDRRRAMAAEMLYDFLMSANAIDMLPPEERQSYPMQYGIWIFPRIQFEIAEILRKCGYDLSKIKSMPSTITIQAITKNNAATMGYSTDLEAFFETKNNNPIITIFFIKGPIENKEEIIGAKRSQIIHELTHLIDSIILSKEIFRHPDKPKKGKRGYDYWNDGIEINARWSQILTNLARIGLIAKNGDPGKFDDRWIYAGRLTMAYDNMKQSKQRKFIKKIYELYMILKDEYEKNKKKRKTQGQPGK